MKNKNFQNKTLCLLTPENKKNQIISQKYRKCEVILHTIVHKTTEKYIDSMTFATILQYQMKNYFCTFCKKKCDYKTLRIFY